MNEIIQQEKAVEIFGYPARVFNVVADTTTGRIRNQRALLGWRQYAKDKVQYRISVELRFDDELNNGHESFSITGSIDRFHRGKWVDDSGGCIHEDIAKHFPALAHLIKWHLTSTDGPMYYLANTTFHAGAKDCYGLEDGERQQLVNGKTKQPSWHLVGIDAEGNEVELHTLSKYADGSTKPDCEYTLEYRPWCRVGKGKVRDLDAARRCAVWPDASDEELSVDKSALEVALLARLPSLLAAFKADMLACGFLWPEVQEA